MIGYLALSGVILTRYDTSDVFVISDISIIPTECQYLFGFFCHVLHLEELKI